MNGVQTEYFNYIPFYYLFLNDVPLLMLMKLQHALRNNQEIIHFLLDQPGIEISSELLKNALN